MRDHKRVPDFVFQVLAFMAAIVVIVFLLSMMYGCSQPSDSEKEAKINQYRLPNGSTNVEIVGNEWYEFDYKGKRFLYRHETHAAHITVIGEAKGE